MISILLVAMLVAPQLLVKRQTAAEAQACGALISCSTTEHVDPWCAFSLRVCMHALARLRRDFLREFDDVRRRVVKPRHQVLDFFSRHRRDFPLALVGVGDE